MGVRRRAFADHERGIAACCQQLTAERIVEPLAEPESEAWNRWELASLAEGNCHVQLDVSASTDDERLAWERRAGFEDRPLPNPHSEYRHPFWLLDGGRRAGTFAVASMYSGFDLLTISSLYVEPGSRRRGVARRALEAAYRAALANG